MEEEIICQYCHFVPENLYPSSHPLFGISNSACTYCEGSIPFIGDNYTLEGMKSMTNNTLENGFVITF